MFTVVAHKAGCLNDSPRANESTYYLFVRSFAPTGAFDAVAVVNAAVEGVVAPIVVLSIVLLVMCKPDWFGLIEAVNG